MLKVPVFVDDPNELLATGAFGAGALVRLERASAEAGAYAEITTIPLVADTYGYSYFDATGAVTSWYRWRVSNSGNTQQTGYSDPYQGIDLNDASLASGRYATLEDLKGTFGQALTDSKRLERMDDLLVVASRQINSRLKFDFWRHPQSATEQRVYDARGSTRLCVHDGIIPGSLASVEFRTTTDAAYEVVTPDTSWYLEPVEAEGYPHFHLLLTGLGSHGAFPTGRQLVRVTAAFGWPEIPADVREATIERAKQLQAWDATKSGGQVGPDDLGAPVGPDRLPDAMWRLFHDYSPLELGTGTCLV